ncbi:hypothetical protein ACUIJ0_01025 [Acinetobacter junii]|uniref:hypothetical protein n=1 Tax=Acinetobacter junii TaxID=40215 RepID=UPI00403DE57C
MNAIQFIKDHGVDKAREVVEGAPHWPVIGWDAVGNNYIFKQCEHAPCSYSNLDNAWSEEYALELILLDDLKRLVDSLDLVKSYGGIINAKYDVKHLDLDWGYDTPRVTRLRQAIADYESIYGGEHV